MNRLSSIKASLGHHLQGLRQLITLRRIVIFCVISVVIWCGVVAGLSALILAYGADNQAQQADVIVVLGSGLRRDGRPGDALYRRSVWAADLYRAGYAPAIICTGAVGYRQVRSEADACGEVLRSQGVPDDVIYLEEQSRSTEENAIYSALMMAENGWDSAVLVTDSFHMLRANWIFTAENGDISYHRSPVPREQVRMYHFTRHFTREIVALHWQVFKEALNLPVTRVG